MGKANYVPYFPQGVKLKKGFIYDCSIDTEIPINSTTNAILSKINGAENVSSIVDNLKTLFKVDEDRLFTDINTMFDGLSNQYMLNWRYISSNKLSTAFLNFIAQYRRGYKERFTVNSNNLSYIFLNILKIVFRKVGIFWLLITVLSLVASLVVQRDFTINFIVYYTIIFAGLITGYAVHESVHLYSYRKSVGKDYFGFVAADIMSVKVIRTVDYNSSLMHVTLLGPLVPGVIGIVGLLVDLFLLNDNYYSKLSMFFILYALHFFYLLPFWGDGKTLFRQLVLLKMKSKLAKSIALNSEQRTK